MTRVIYRDCHISAIDAESCNDSVGRIIMDYGLQQNEGSEFILRQAQDEREKAESRDDMQNNLLW